MRKQRQVINPLAMLAGRQKLTPEVVTEYALPAWLWLDAVMRGAAPEGAVKGLTKIIVLVQIIAADRQNKPLYDNTAKTVRLWLAALELAEQHGVPVDPSTSLRTMLRLCVSTWDSLLPQIDMGLLVGAMERWNEHAHVFGMDAAHA